VNARRRLVGALAFLPALTLAQTSRVPTVTRLVKLFLDLEAELLLAQLNKDRAALERRLVDDFEMRSAARPGEPIPRADWLTQALEHKPPPMEIEQMAVHDEGTVALVSFLLRPHDTKLAPTFVVDTWSRIGDEWRLKTRYAAAVGAGRPFGDPGASPRIDKRY
jgi:hypothetical protein